MEDSGYSGAMAPVYAAAAAELVRLLKESAGESGGLHEAMDAADALASVTQLLRDLPIALQQVSAWLDRENAQGRVFVDFGPYERHPDDAVGVVNAYLAAVDQVLAEAPTGLRAAHAIAETLTTAGPGGTREGVSDVSTDVDTPGHGPAAGASLLRFPRTVNRSTP